MTSNEEVVVCPKRSTCSIMSIQSPGVMPEDFTAAVLAAIRTE